MSIEWAVIIGAIYAAIGMFMAGHACDEHDDLLEMLAIHFVCVLLWPVIVLWAALT